MTAPRSTTFADGARVAIAARIGWTILTILLVETVLCAAALLPVVLIWSLIVTTTPAASALQLAVFSLAIVPSYVLFALLFMLLSALAIRGMKWQTPAGLETRIARMEWPLLHWARYMAAIHLVRLTAGALFRGSPVWTAYLKLAGARLGRRVYVNSLALTDYNLLEFGDDVVIGDGVRLSGHTVEHGVLKSAPVRLGRNVTVGVGSIIDIGVEAGDGCQIGALTLVPKYSRLEAGAVYAGIPAQQLVPPAGHRWRQRRSLN
ncbi:MAG TPA: hypothetical protein VFJ02_03225 [Vicinamibacterales bacterium]|nr:hypothetical protein [Vicinamibacterales bacterium]